MSEPAPRLEKPQVAAYRELAREALERVAECNSRAHKSELEGHAHIALELSQEALVRAQRYKALADLAEKHT